MGKRDELIANQNHPGVRAAIGWLHARAAEMKDDHAKAVLNTAASDLGVSKLAVPEPEPRAPIAWTYEYTNHSIDGRAPGGWLRAVTFEPPTKARVMAGFVRNIRPLGPIEARAPYLELAELADTLALCTNARNARGDILLGVQGLERLVELLRGLAPSPDA